jgi:hypothetical protein
MRTLHRLHVQVAYAFFFNNSGVLTVRQWARYAITKSSHIVFVSAEVLLWRCQLDFEGAEILIDAMPNGFVVMHD